METNTLNKKDTSYRTFCHVCLSRDRRLFSIEKYANIFQSICEGKFTSHTLLCWECTATLRRIKQFKERVEFSTKILNKYVNGPVNHFNSLSNLKITENVAIIKYEECEKFDDIKVEIVINSNDDYNPITNYSLEEKKELIDVKEEFSDNDNDIAFNDTDSFENNDLYLEVKYEDEETLTTGKKSEVKSEEKTTTSKTSEVKTEEKTTTSKRSEVKSEEKPTTSKKSKLKKKIKKPYRIIPIDKENLVRKVLLTAEEVMSYMDEQRLSLFYKNSAYRCEQCALSWKSENGFLQHNKKYHAKSAGKHQCDICLSRFKTNKDMTLHMQRHFIILECCTCAYRSYRDMNGHILESHHKKFECTKCNARFREIDENTRISSLMFYKFIAHEFIMTDNIYLFYQHHKELHVIFTCDICGRKAKTKRVIEKHIRRHYEKFECNLCDRKYKTRDCLRQHQEFKHSPKTADAYCVQCDKKFSNIAVYKDHLLRSSAHAAESTAKKVACPVCGRQYTRKTHMKDHYMHVHMKQSKHYCELCNKYFLQSTRYSQHMKYTHEGVKREKNKMCNICGRGFSTNRSLTNHIRTHTGEKPHECSYCGAKFIQSYSMRLHVKNVHLKNKRPNFK